MVTYRNTVVFLASMLDSAVPGVFQSVVFFNFTLCQIIIYLWCLCVCAHSSMHVFLIKQTHIETSFEINLCISVHFCTECVRCVRVCVCIHFISVHSGVPAPRKCLYVKTVSGCVMRTFLLWFGPILKCCPTLGLQRERFLMSVGMFHSQVCIYVQCILYIIWVNKYKHWFPSLCTSAFMQHIYIISL